MTDHVVKEAINSREILISRLISLSRPESGQIQNLEETNSRLIEALNEAMSFAVIDDDLLKEILEHIRLHLEQVRAHLETAERKNLWRFHNQFCLAVRNIVFVGTPQ